MITKTVMYTTLIWGGVLLCGACVACVSDSDAWSGLFTAGILLLGAGIVMGVMEMIAGGVTV